MSLALYRIELARWIKHHAYGPVPTYRGDAHGYKKANVKGVIHRDMLIRDYWTLPSQIERCREPLCKSSTGSETPRCSGRRRATGDGIRQPPQKGRCRGSDPRTADSYPDSETAPAKKLCRMEPGPSHSGRKHAGWLAPYPSCVHTTTTPFSLPTRLLFYRLRQCYRLPP